jgi:hypothetical protein
MKGFSGGVGSITLATALGTAYLSGGVRNIGKMAAQSLFKF